MLATYDAGTIRDWWDKWPQSNIGGVVAAGVVVLDIDPRNNGDVQLDMLLEKHGPLPATVEVHTAGGGRHLYFTGNQKGKRDIARGVELLGEGCNVVLAGSIGRNGREYEYELSSSQDLTEIAPAPDWLLCEQTSPEDNSEASKLAGTGARLTTWPTSPPRSLFSLPAYIPVGERNVTLTKQAGLLRYQGKEEPEIASLLSQANSEHCSPPLPEQEVRKISHSLGKKPKGKGRDTKQVERARAIAGELTTLACSLRWPGRQGASQRAVLLAFLSYALEAGSTLLTISVRQAAERAGLTSFSAWKAIVSLSEQGWLTLQRKRYNNRPNKYFLHSPQEKSLTTSTVQSPKRQEETQEGVELLCYVRDFSDDAFRWKGLGKNAALVYGKLTQKPSKLADLIATVAIPKSTLCRVLERLKEQGLAVRSAKGWWRGDGSLNDAAEKLGTARKGAEERHRHVQERKKFEEELTQRKSGTLIVVPKRAEEGLRYAASFKKRPEPKTARAKQRERQKYRGRYAPAAEARKSKRGVKNA